MFVVQFHPSMNREAFQVVVAGESLQGHVYHVPDPVAAVIVVHGMGEYGRRYERSLVPYLLESSIEVITYDQFGHGMNSGKKGHHPGYEHLLDSIDKMIDLAKELVSDKPVFLYGHSMGGNVALGFALSRPGKLSGLVVTSPFLRLAFEPPAWKLAIGRLLAGVWPSITMSNEVDPASLSRIEEEVEAYRNDPLVHDRVSPAYSIGIMERGEWVMGHAKDLKTPLLLMHGTSDRLTDFEASREFAQNAGDRVEFVAVEGGYHELHHDLEREKVLEKAVEWIKAHSRS